jgi:nickel-type superoxide dismutase maturation protease
MTLGLVTVAGASMSPALESGDVLLVRWGAHGVRSGQVVVARWPDHPALVCKRAVRRSEAGWWLLGDNASGSDDSRQRGPTSEVLGRVLLRVRRAAR